MDRSFSWYAYFLAAWLFAAAVIPAVGCRSLLTTVVYLVKGTNVDADNDGLKEKRVAVVCRPLASLSFRDSSVARDIAREVGILLRTNGRKIDVIGQDKVSEWIDEHDWTDYAEIGEALEAETVVGIDLLSFTIYQEQTLYQGKADVAIKVVECTDGEKVVFEKELPQVVYPPNTGIETMSKPESEFRRKFVRVLADQIARHFYPHDPYADFALDATALD